MPRLLKSAAALGAASLLLVPALALRAQPPAPASADPAAAKKADAPETARAKTAADVVERIKNEGTKKSEVMKTLSYLTDVIGPRLTGTPGLKRANEWTRDTLTKWGMENAHLESWGPFGKGWTLKRFSAQVTEPQCIPLIAFPKAWSPATDGTVVGEVVFFDPKTDDDYAKYKGKLKNAIVLTSAVVDVPAHFEPLGTRKTDKELLDLADAPEPAQRKGQRGGRPQFEVAAKKADGPGAEKKADGTPAVTKAARPGGGAPMTEEQMAARMAEMRARAEAMGKKTKFLTEEGAAAVLEPSRIGDGGTLFVAQASVPGANMFGAPGGTARRVSAWDKDAPKFLPQIVVAAEHYNRLVRMIQQGETLKMSLDLAVQFNDDDPNAYNTVAEIPGTDLKEEVVMLGGHLDSWHSGTGATDNAAGVAVGMEAMRILKALDLKPRRTVRIGLWTGEEQGLYGSRAYVSKHFGKSYDAMAAFGGPPDRSKPPTPDSTQQAEFDKFSAYYNLDNGTGKIRGIYLQGNEAARPLFRKWLQPFREMGAQTISASNTGGTDHQSFDGIGLPGFQFIQDEIEYNTRTHHSNMDVFDRIQADDMKQAAVILASFVYNTATQDEKIVRKPAPPAPPTPAPAAGTGNAAGTSSTGSGR